MHKKHYKNYIATALISLCMLTGVSATACSDPGTTQKEEPKITLDATSKTLDVGSQITLVASKNNDEEVIWTTNKPEIATVDNGVVTGIAEGEALITATLKDSNKSAFCNIVVTSNLMPVLTLDHETLELVVGGDNVKISHEVKYGDEKVDATIQWVSQDEKIATVKDGIVTAVNKGSTEIIATATYKGKTTEAKVKVTVKPNLSITVDKEVVNLVTYKLDEVSKTSETINLNLLVNGITMQNPTFSLEVNGESAEVKLEGQALKVKAIKEGTTKAIVKYEDEDKNSTSSEVTINVSRPSLNETEIFTININDQNAKFDFSEYDFNKDVKAIYDGETLVTSLENPFLINQGWLKEQAIGSIKSLRVDCANYDVNIQVKIDNSYKNLNVELLENGRDGTTLEKVNDPVSVGFKENEEVLKWTSSGDNWVGRIGFGDLSEYGHWVFDVMFTSKITNEIDFWIGSGHVMQMLPNGVIEMLERGGYQGDSNTHKKENCFKIFDENNKLVLGEVLPNVRYTIDINLAHRGNKPLYEIGSKDRSAIYITNPVAYTNEYYDTHIAPTRDENVIKSVKVEKTIEATHTLDFKEYDWADQVEGLYVDGVKISEENNATKVSKEWLTKTNTGTYELTVKLLDGTTYRGSIEVTVGSIDTSYFLPDGERDGTYIKDVDDPVSVGFNEGDTVQKYYSGTKLNNNWSNRIQSRANINNMNWWIFDIVFTEDVFTGEADKDVLVFWVASGHVLMVKADGSVALYSGGANYGGSATDHAKENCVTIYNSKGQVQEGKLLPNEKYTFEINTKHKGNTPHLYEIGCYASTTYYIGNSFACTDEYYETYLKNKVGLDKTRVSLELNETLQLNATDNADGSLKKTWASSNDNVVTVENGLIKAVGYGEAVITVTLENGFKAYCYVTVLDHDKPVIILDKEEVTLIPEETITINVETKNDLGETLKADISWESMDETIATVTNGVIKGVKVGETKIKVTAINKGKETIKYINVTIGGYKELQFSKAGHNPVDTYGIYEGDKTLVGFNETDTVYKWHCASNSWDDRIEVGNIKEYDYWVFDFSISRQIADDKLINFWIGTNHTLQMNGQGYVKIYETGGFSGTQEEHDLNNCISILDENGNNVINQKLEANKKYKMVISLAHQGNGPTFGIGSEELDFDVYISNVFACNQKFYDAFIKK